MADRVQVDIEGLRDKIEAFQSLERRPSVSQMVRVLIEEALEARGEPPNIETEKEQAIEFIKSLISGSRPSNCELVKLAQAFDLEEEKLVEICDRLFPKTRKEKHPNGQH
ncbi:MAG: hypothetical protein SAL07_23675 [Oscillatoria sp. PMC 1051.18]|nr:hypothetical protein [Oscillatoria sp. PMC 1050.18]MEC5032913.1 hypothetical protein [Oscillatoria sp. PMC 1051.18]